MTNAFDVEVTQDEIKSQEARRSEIDQSIGEYDSKIAQLRKQRELVDLMIESLKSSLPSQSVEIPVELPTNHEHSSDQISKSSTLDILKNNSDGRGMQVKDVEFVYIQRGVDIVGRTVFRHIEALINENKAFQVNPDAQRYRRYKAVQNTGGLPSLPPVKSESE